MQPEAHKFKQPAAMCFIFTCRPRECDGKQCILLSTCWATAPCFFLERTVPFSWPANLPNGICTRLARARMEWVENQSCATDLHDCEMYILLALAVCGALPPPKAMHLAFYMLSNGSMFFLERTVPFSWPANLPNGICTRLARARMEWVENQSCATDLHDCGMYILLALAVCGALPPPKGMHLAFYMLSNGSMFFFGTHSSFQLAS